MANEETQWDRSTLLIVRSSIAAGALLSCILVFILDAAFTCRDKDARKLPTLRLILYITLASIARSIIIIIQVSPVLDSSLHHNDMYCVTTGYLYRTVSMMGILFTLTATVHMLLVTFAVKYSWKFEVGYVLVSIILPLTYTWIPFTYDKALLQGWCSVSTNDTCHQLQWGIIYNADIPRLIVEAINTFLVIVTLSCGMPRRCIQMKKDGEEIGVLMKQVLPILVHSVFYLGINWFSLTDHLRNGTCSSHGKGIQLAHAITSAGRGLLVGITFSAYYFIILYIRWKHQNATVDVYGTISASSSLTDSQKIN
uniref:G-protein coupled receptors family 1 profile domain-containing protein n=1 Tax=Amphimedon queenslandica TaxID=400682 RepID=A0A1X7V7P8_AMPQE